MTYDITAFGAVGNGITLNTSAIQSAIDACSDAGGGRVNVPAGIFKTGTLWLRSNIELHLEHGATLLASDNLDDYNGDDAYAQNFGYPELEQWHAKHLIIALETTNTSITGFGTVDGNCYAFVDDDFENMPTYGWRYGKTKIKDMSVLRPGPLVVFVECTHVDIRDFTIRNAPCWSLLIHGCEYVSVRGYKALNPRNMLNSDGLDIDTCRYVTVSDCIIDTGDDAIAIRCCEHHLKNKNIHCEYITVTNCVFRTGICAFRLGVGFGTIRHVQISNISVERSCMLVQFCTAYLENGCAHISDINISNICATETDRFIQLFTKNGATVKNVTLENISAECCAMSYIECEDGAVENITLKDIDITLTDRKTELTEAEFKKRGAHLFKLRGAAEVRLDNVKIRGSLYGCDEPISITDCDGLVKKDCNF